MSKIEIEWAHDEMDCETCGPSWAEGARVKIDGVPFGDFEPYAHCYNSTDHSKEKVYAALFKQLDHELIETDQPYEPTNQDADDDYED